MKLEFIWPHKMEVRLNNPEMSAAEIIVSVEQALDAGKGFNVCTPGKMIIIPAQLLATALIEIKE